MNVGVVLLSAVFRARALNSEVKVIHDRLDVLNRVALEDDDDFLDDLDLADVFSDGSIKVVDISLAEIVVRSECLIKSCELIFPAGDALHERLDFVSEADDLAVEAEDFVVAVNDTVVEFAHQVRVVLDSLLLGSGFRGESVLLVSQEIVDDVDEVLNESLISLNGDVLGHLHENGVE